MKRITLHCRHTYKQDLEILKLLHDEWKYRLSNFWSLMIKTIIISFILIFMPLMYEYWGVNFVVIEVPLYILPLTGLIFSIVICFFTSIEIIKINSIKTSIRRSIMEISPGFKVAFTKRNILHQNIPIVICIFQVVLSTIMIILIAK